jgi:long-chain acyl-CoA synthetase
MHSFGNLSYVGSNAVAYLNIDHREKFFSYLPLSHSAERIIIEIGSLFSGGEIWFADSVETFQKNLVEAKPTVFFAVHRIWQKFQQGILAKISQKKLDRLLQIPGVASFIRHKIKKGLGLHQANNIFCGASPISPSLLQWFSKLGINIQEAYGTTEDCCYSHITTKAGIKQGFVGQPFPYCTVRLGANNEVQLKQKALMLGYYKEPELTKEAFTPDGFYKTGDEGFIDEKGFLKITGRVKDLFKTSKGKYIAPAPIEMKLLGCNELEGACIVGSGLPQPIALVTISANGSRKSKEDLHFILEETLTRINNTLDPHEHLKKMIVLAENWTVENELLTPTLKIKRQVIEKKYAAQVEEWQHIRECLIWEKEIN